MKRQPITKFLVAVIAFVLVCTSVLALPVEAKAATNPTKITLAVSKKKMYVGEKYTLKVKSVKPKKASKSVTYQSSNTKVATVNSKGKITAKKAGTSTITVLSKTNKKVKATCKITVIKQPIKKITVTNAVNNTVAVRIGKKLKLKTSVTPTKAGDKKLTYTSSNKKVATVNSKGQITAKKAGTAKITIKAAVGKAKTTITVKVPAKNKVVKSVTLSPKTKSLEVGQNFSLKATIKPTNATVKNVSYKSSNTKVATVNSKGKVTAKGVGTAKITVTTLDGSKKATCSVTVKAKTVPTVPVTGVTLSATSATLDIGKTLNLTATVTPANATNKNVSWSSSNTAVATVSGGVVTAKAAGTATITVTTADGNKKATCAVTVKAAAQTPEEIAITGVSLDQEKMTVYANGIGKLTATVEPANTTMDQTVTFTSNNDKVTVAADGTITPKVTDSDEDTVTAAITATTTNGKTATCEVTVIVRKSAKSEDDNSYSFALDKNAESYDITRNGYTASVTPDAVKEDLETLAGIQWNNSTLKDKWNSEAVQKAMKLAVAQELGLESRMTIEVVSDNTMSVTAKGKTAVITRSDNADGTSNLNIAVSGKTMGLNNITVIDDKEKNTYIIDMAAQSGSTTMNLRAEIKKDASSMALRQVYSDGTSGEIASVVSGDNAYSIKIVKNMYKTLLDLVGISDPIKDAAVVNCYVAAKAD